ncbi:Metastasis suppressor protein 1 [Chionoecetes opilio]|uniref:Metastasis suppressor protein 1 n=1 Tax=Chionoecetes opilio TaxID=41210 RepID=A0A8J4YL25_CHIOP|nr:Metastasis suppressor protein 1 [Chionoecetes opilio]
MDVDIVDCVGEEEDMSGCGYGWKGGGGGGCALVECVVLPLQERVEEWRRAHHALDKDHTKEYKKARSEIKKRAENAARLQKKAKKAGKNSELNKVLESTVVDLRARFGALEEVERSAVRNALTEERARYCAFAHALAPVLVEEVGLVGELGHLQEVMTQLEKHVADPHTLPPASEQVLLDIKGGEAQWSWQTPPSSPSSLGSRKSSMCSISSLNSSSSSSTHSPSHHTRPRSVSQGTRLVSVSSQDSGFTSQDTLCQPSHTPALQASGLSEHSVGSEGSTPSPATTNATWPNLTDPSLQHKPMPPLNDRPHTISSAYEKGRDRPPLTVYTFQPPEGRSGLGSPKVCSQPCSPVCLEMAARLASTLAPWMLGKTVKATAGCLVASRAASSAASLPRTPMWLGTQLNLTLVVDVYLCLLQLDSGCMSPLMGHTATISRRSSRTSLHHNLSSSSQESLTASGKSKPPVPNRCSSLERPAVPEKKPVIRTPQHLTQQQQQPPQRGMPQSSSNKLMPLLPDFNKAAPDMIVPQPVYSNMAEICSNVSSGNYMQHGSGSEAKEPERPSVCVAAGSKGPVSTPSPEMTSASEGIISAPSGTLRRSGSHGHKPPPPVRRTPSISTITTASPSASSLSNLNPSSSCISLNNSPTHLNSSSSTLSSSSSINGNINSGGSGSPSQGSSTSSPLQRTDSESSTPVGSLENLPPPPAFLLEDGVEDTNPTPDPDLTTPEGIRFICDPAGPPAPIQDKCLQQRVMTVSDTVKTLQESHHQPPSPVTHRRSQSLRCNQPAYKTVQLLEERRVSLEDARASLMTTLNAQLAAQMNQQQSKPVQKPYMVREGSQSPRMSRSRLGSVQEVTESPHHPPASQPVVRETKQDSSGVNREQEQVPYQQAAHHYPTQIQPNSRQVPESHQMQMNEDKQNSGSQPGTVLHKDPSHMAFLDSLNKKLFHRQSGEGAPSPGSPKLQPRKAHPGGAPTPHPKPHPNGSTPVAHVQRSGSGASEKASKVRQWIASKTMSSEKKGSVVETAALRESLFDQIKRGKQLRKAKYVADSRFPVKTFRVPLRDTPGNWLDLRAGWSPRGDVCMAHRRVDTPCHFTNPTQCKWGS